MKIAVITCYKDPNYIRARTIRAALKLLPNTEVLIIKNKSTSLLRYPEVILKIISIRLSKNPDVYLITFRGYEILPFVLLFTWHKPVIFDEFINLIEWTIYEHQKIKLNSFAAKILQQAYNWLLQKCRLILTDTVQHAQYSAQLSHLPLSRYLAIPVGTDEQVFQPTKSKIPATQTDRFQVFYYGNMLPLHGLSYILKSAEILKSQPKIEFLLIGGNKKAARQIAEAKKRGANITYQKWVNFTDLPQIIAHANLCLGGPFGNTIQSQLVITGKTYQFLALAKPTIIGINQATTLFRNQKNCLLVPQADSQSLAEKIEWAYTHQDKLIQIGNNGKMIYHQFFSIQKISTLLSVFFQTLSD